MPSPTPQHSPGYLNHPPHGVSFLIAEKGSFELLPLVDYFRTRSLDVWGKLEAISGDDRLKCFSEALRETVLSIDTVIAELCPIRELSTLSERSNYVDGRISAQVKAILEKDRESESHVDFLCAASLRDAHLVIDLIRAVLKSPKGSERFTELQRRAAALCLEYEDSAPVSALQSLVGRMIGVLSAAQGKIEGIAPLLYSSHPTVASEGCHIFSQTALSIGRARVELNGTAAGGSDGVGPLPLKKMALLLSTYLSQLPVNSLHNQEKFSSALKLTGEQGLKVMREYLQGTVENGYYPNKGIFSHEYVAKRDFGFDQLAGLIESLESSQQTMDFFESEVFSTKSWLSSLVYNDDIEVKKRAHFLLERPLFTKHLL